METKNTNNVPEHDKLKENTDKNEELFKLPTLIPSQPKISENITKPTTEDERSTHRSNFENLSPAEQIKESKTPIPYKEPPWGGLGTDKYYLEVLKNGVIIDNIKLTKSFYVFGRLPSCDITMEHPSLSRHHAVLQFCKKKSESQNIGWYLYDLDSTHGTWINKNRVYSKRYYWIRVGHVLKFGGSSRLYILQGPDDDKEEESEMSITDLKEQREKQKKEAEVLRLADIASQEQKIAAFNKTEVDSGCCWGMGDDAQDEDSVNPFSEDVKLESEELYLDDPKKALKGFYEREGYEEPEYVVTDASNGKYKCAVELPVDGPNGQPIIAEAIVSGKKKEAVLQCALEGCRILDRMNLLRAATHESRKRKEKNWEDDDFYDSDEDLYLDRTGDIEKKRHQRMKKAGKVEQKTETYQSLLEKHEVIIKDILEIEGKLDKAKADAAAMDSEDMDALDAYMNAIKSGIMDTKTKMALKRQLMELKQEEAKVRKLVNIAKPASLPELKSLQSLPKPLSVPIVNKLPIVGKKKTQKRPFATTKPRKEVLKRNEEFVEEEDDEDETAPDKCSRLKEEPEICNKKSCKLNEQPTEADMTGRLSKSKEQPLDMLTGRLSKKKEDPVNRSKQKTVNTEGKIQGDYDCKDPDYAVWMPPSDQTGDGRTSLNEKLGY